MDKSNVTYKGKKVSIGIDVHRSFFVVSAVSEGVLVKRCRIKPEGIRVIEFINKYFSGAVIESCYEAGYSGFWLHRYLVGQGIANIVINPASIETEASNRVKTDKRDSLKMAQQLNAGRLRCIYIPSEEQELRRLYPRTREQLVRARTRVRLQIRMKLHQFGLLPAEQTGVMTSKQAKKLIEGVSHPALKVSLEILFLQWEQLSKGISVLNNEIKKEGVDNKIESTYRTVPGFGIISSRLIASELGDMSQFPNEGSLFSYTGLTPCEHSSGDNIRRGHISRQGSSQLRHILTEVAWRAIRKDKQLREHFEQLAKRRGKKIAIVGIARKLIGRVRAIFKAKSVYELEYKKAA